jgi:hypothetical protein
MLIKKADINDTPTPKRISFNTAVSPKPKPEPIKIPKDLHHPAPQKDLVGELSKFKMKNSQIKKVEQKKVEQKKKSPAPKPKKK